MEIKVYHLAALVAVLLLSGVLLFKGCSGESHSTAKTVSTSSAAKSSPLRKPAHLAAKKSAQKNVAPAKTAARKHKAVVRAKLLKAAMARRAALAAKRAKARAIAARRQRAKALAQKHRDAAKKTQHQPSASNPPTTDTSPATVPTTPVPPVTTSVTTTTTVAKPVSTTVAKPASTTSVASKNQQKVDSSKKVGPHLKSKPVLHPDPSPMGAKSSTPKPDPSPSPTKSTRPAKVTSKTEKPKSVDRLHQGGVVYVTTIFPNYLFGLKIILREYSGHQVVATGSVKSCGLTTFHYKHLHDYLCQKIDSPATGNSCEFITTTWQVVTFTQKVPAPTPTTPTTTANSADSSSVHINLSTEPGSSVVHWQAFQDPTPSGAHIDHCHTVVNGIAAGDTAQGKTSDDFTTRSGANVSFQCFSSDGINSATATITAGG